jgi:hypothetical protein
LGEPRAVCADDHLAQRLMNRVGCPLPQELTIDVRDLANELFGREEPVVPISRC